MTTFKAICFQTGRHIKQDETSNMKIRIYHNRESQYIAPPATISSPKT